jgi:hypothetical protein
MFFSTSASDFFIAFEGVEGAVGSCPDQAEAEIDGEDGIAGEVGGVVVVLETDVHLLNVVWG